MATTVKFVQGIDYQLSGAGCSSLDTTITLAYLIFPDDSLVEQTDIGDMLKITFEPDTNNEENATFTTLTQNADGTATLSGGVRGMKFKYPYDADASLAYSHAGGSTVRVTNNTQFYATFANNGADGTITALWQFPNDASTPVLGASYVAPTLSNQVASKGYIDSVAIAGAPNANATTIGITQLSVNPVNPLIPIALAANDPFVVPYIKESLGTTKGDTISFSGANTAVRIPVGTDGQVLTANSGVAAGVSWKNAALFSAGTFSYDTSTASGTTTVAHGLAVVPLYITLQALYPQSPSIMGTSFGGSDGTNNFCIMSVIGSIIVVNNNGAAIVVEPSGGNGVSATVTLDATNITFHWTKSGGPTGNVYVYWRAET